MSKFLSLNSVDFLKGGVMAALAVILAGVYSCLVAVPPHFPASQDWSNMLIAAAAAFVGYLIKNLFTNSSNQLLKKEQK